MTSLDRRVTEECTTNDSRRLLPRREAIRQLGRMGIAAVSISTAAVACDDAPTRHRGAAKADAFVDFTDKADGDPPDRLDTGQEVDYVQNAWKPRRAPRILDGELVHGELPDEGAFANYYQARLNRSIRTFGTTWTVDSRDGSTHSGVMCLAAWSTFYESGTGMTVPRTPAHIVIDTVMGKWQWWVSDGEGVGSRHLKVVKAGTFSPPASDGATVWAASVYLDIDAGIGQLFLPGPDAATSRRFVTLSDTEIAAGLTAAGLPATTIRATQQGADVVMVEHFAQATVKKARYPRFQTMWANARPPTGEFDGSPS